MGSYLITGAVENVHGSWGPLQLKLLRQDKDMNNQLQQLAINVMDKASTYKCRPTEVTFEGGGKTRAPGCRTEEEEEDHVTLAGRPIRKTENRKRHVF